MPRVLGVIPVRLESTRLPRKALRAICGYPMIAWVYRRARRAPGLDELLVATDSNEVAVICRSYNIPVEMTASHHRSGTDRIAEVMRSRPADVYVNIQGDEPMIEPGHIDRLLDLFDRLPDLQVATLKVRISLEEARNPNHTKVVTDRQGYALYFSRAVIPAGLSDDGPRQAPDIPRYYKHLGVYAYTSAALAQFSSLPPGELEQQERLEQLRFLENSIRIAVAETDQNTIGVDTEDDLLRVEAYFRRTNVALP